MLSKKKIQPKKTPPSPSAVRGQSRAADPPRPQLRHRRQEAPHGHGRGQRRGLTRHSLSSCAPSRLRSEAGRGAGGRDRRLLHSRKIAKSPRPRRRPSGEKPGWAYGKTGAPPLLLLSTAQTAGDHPSRDTGSPPGTRSSPHGELTRTAVTPARVRAASAELFVVRARRS